MHFYVCAYPKGFEYKIDDLLGSIEKKVGYHREKHDKRFYKFMASACKYFNKKAFAPKRNARKILSR